MNHKTWYGWIPTNIGRLNFNYIGTHKDILQSSHSDLIFNENDFEIKNYSTNFISDTFVNNAPNWLRKLLLPQLENEIFPSVDIYLKKENTLFTGDITIKYNNNNLSITSKIEIERNGKTKFGDFKYKNKQNINYSQFETFDLFEDHIAQVFFVILKGIIHGDHHHHQKVDVAIPVTKYYFQPEFIINKLIQQVKRIEYDIKSITRCGNELKIKNSIEEMNGYKSYIITFSKLFIKPTNEKLHNNKLEILDNVLLSLESSVNKNKNKLEVKDKIYTTFLTYLAVIISLTILYCSNTEVQFFTMTSSLYALLILGVFSYLGLHLNCKIKAYLFYNKYYVQEFLYHLKYIDNSKIKRFQRFIKFLTIHGKRLYYALIISLSCLLLYNHYQKKYIIK